MSETYDIIEGLRHRVKAAEEQIEFLRKDRDKLHAKIATLKSINHKLAHRLGEEVSGGGK